MWVWPSMIKVCLLRTHTPPCASELPPVTRGHQDRRQWEGNLAMSISSYPEDILLHVEGTISPRKGRELPRLTVCLTHTQAGLNITDPGALTTSPGQGVHSRLQTCSPLPLREHRRHPPSGRSPRREVDHEGPHFLTPRGVTVWPDRDADHGGF